MNTLLTVDEFAQQAGRIYRENERLCRIYRDPIVLMEGRAIFTETSPIYTIGATIHVRKPARFQSR